MIIVERCHDLNLESMTGNVGAVLKGYLTFAKPQNEHIKRTCYLKKSQHFIILKNIIIFKTNETKNLK